MTRTQMAQSQLRDGADFSPLFRSMIGFDRLASLLDGGAVTNAYPPYNIEKMGDDAYRISMAVAGFTQDDMDITVENGTLSVQGRKPDVPPEDGSVYLHRGIATRAFEQRFSLADHVEVTDASLANGMLTIDLVRVVPERLKPRKIEVKHSSLDGGILDKAKGTIAKSSAEPK